MAPPHLFQHRPMRRRVPGRVRTQGPWQRNDAPRGHAVRVRKLDNLEATLRSTDPIEFSRRFSLPRRGTGTARTARYAGRTAAGVSAPPSHPKTPGSTDTGGTNTRCERSGPSAAHAVGLARSSADRSPSHGAQPRPPRHPPMARRQCSVAMNADRLRRLRLARCAPRGVRPAGARGRLRPRLAPVTTRPATGGGMRGAGSDRRQKRSSGQWRQGDC